MSWGESPSIRCTDSRDFPHHISMVMRGTGLWWCCKLYAVGEMDCSTAKCYGSDRTHTLAPGSPIQRLNQLNYLPTLKMKWRRETAYLCKVVRVCSSLPCQLSPDRLLSISLDLVLLIDRKALNNKLTLMVWPDVVVAESGFPCEKWEVWIKWLIQFTLVPI